MKRKLNILTLLYMTFLFLLFLSGSLSGVFSSIIYLLSFALPIGIGIFYSKDNESRLLSVSREKIGFTLPIVMPTVSLVILMSFLTGLLIFAFTGRTNEVDIGDSFIPAIISHAVLPAILEELLFRYIPYRLLARHSRAMTVVASAFFFALVHHDLFSIPYAFVAGGIFMAIDLATESVVPSIIIHFINNAISVGLIIYSDNPALAPTMYTLVAVLTVISVAFIVKRRGEYKKSVIGIFDRGEGVTFTGEMLIFALMTLFIAVASLI